MIITCWMGVLIWCVYVFNMTMFADVRYGWGPWQVGWVLFLVGVCSVIVNVAVVGRAVRALGERRALITETAAAR